MSGPDKFEMIAGGVVLVILIGMIALSIIDRCTSWLPKWFCDHLDWHKTPVKIGFDGCSLNGRCPRCNRRVLADSNGDYFAAGRQED